MRAIWTGEISFGLVSIPTKLYAATQDHTPAFHWLHKVCGTRVQTVRRCPRCDRDVPWAEIEKGCEVSKGKYARFTKEELAEVETDEPKGLIEIVSFVSPEEVDLAFISKSYWVGASGKNAQSFTLLRTVLEKSGKVGLAKVALPERTHLALLRPRERLFSLDMMRYAADLVAATDVESPPAKIPSDKELKLAASLVAQLTEKFHPERHPDEYLARVTALVDGKVKKHQIEGEGEEEAPASGAKKKAKKSNVVDLAEMLARSLAATKSRAPHAKGKRAA